MTHHLCQIADDTLNIMKSLKDVQDVYSDEVSFWESGEVAADLILFLLGVQAESRTDESSL